MSLLIGKATTTHLRTLLTISELWLAEKRPRGNAGGVISVSATLLSYRALAFTLHPSSPSPPFLACTTAYRRHCLLDSLIRRDILLTLDPDRPTCFALLKAGVDVMELPAQLGDAKCAPCTSHPSHRIIPCRHSICYDHLLLGHDQESRVSSLCAKCGQVCFCCLVALHLVSSTDFVHFVDLVCSQRCRNRKQTFRRVRPTPRPFIPLPNTQNHLVASKATTFV